MDGSELTDWDRQLAILRGLTATTGVIHDAQLFQIKNWGIIAFQYLDPGEWEARVNIETKTVSYKLLKTRKKPKDLVMLIAGLDRSIHWLFGEDWGLSINEKGKQLYQGPRTVKTNEQRKQRAGNRESKK